jgi:hypothetical protein
MSVIQDFLEPVVKQIRINRPNQQYSCADDYILQNGHLFESVPLDDTEKQVFENVIWKENKRKECYYNAQRLALYLTLDGENVEYCEGVAYDPKAVIPVNHAWVSINGKVVDPTWGERIITKNKVIRRINRVIGIIPEGWEYYGITIPTVDIWSYLADHQAHGSLIDDYECGWPMLRGLSGLHKAKA